uniref:Putative disulfide isomerase n=1 Tax=Trypanosoma vivax (strain Y486) TaxID=1055687 RepID=G0TV87_TRYVY|nr:putative disulfide isomerase, fragment [Trypanosoma vivax Y486]
MPPLFIKLGFIVVFSLHILSSWPTLSLPTAHAALPIDVEGDAQGHSVVLLDTETFDAQVFSHNHVDGVHFGKPWLIIFFAAWCGHCRVVLPQFVNASRLLSQNGIPHASFGMVDAVKSRELVARFKIRSYPTLLYTTGKGNNCHVFQGSRNFERFVSFSIHLQKAADTGSFAEVVSDPERFLSAQKRWRDSRVPMYIYLPPKSSGTSSVLSVWNVAVDAASSMENIRFGIVHGDAIPSDWKSSRVPSYIAVVKAAMQCRGRGPDGALLIVDSDAYTKPHCYEGPWFEGDVETNIDKINDINDSILTLHPLIDRFFTLNGFRAVEEASPTLFFALRRIKNQLLGVLVTNGPISPTDNNMLPVLREVVRKRNEAASATPSSRLRIIHSCHLGHPSGCITAQSIVTYVDGSTQVAWREHYKLKLDELPTFIVIDAHLEKVYKMGTHALHFETIKHTLPWRLGGQQQAVIETFIESVERGEVSGERMTIAGKISDWLLPLPGMDYVHTVLGFEDSLFVLVVLSLAFFVIVLVVVFVVDPLVTRLAESSSKREAIAVAKKQD